MYHCPSCGRSAQPGRAACECGADLTLLATLDAMADAWFNRGVGALAEGNSGRAVEWFAASAAARPDDVEALLALALSWARLDRPREALSSLDRAAEKDATHPDIKPLRDALPENPDSMKNNLNRARKRDPRKKYRIRRISE